MRIKQMYSTYNLVLAVTFCLWTVDHNECFSFIGPQLCVAQCGGVELCARGVVSCGGVPL